MRESTTRVGVTAAYKDPGRVTVNHPTTSATTYITKIDLGFTSVPNLPTQVFQMRYKVTGDTFTASAMTGAVERQCSGTLNSVAFATVDVDW